MLEFGGNGIHGLNTGSTVSGTGEVAFTGGTTNLITDVYDVTGTTRISGGTANFNSLALTDELIINGGTRGGLGTIDVIGHMNWTAGTLRDSGMTNANGTLELSGNTKTLNFNHIFSNAAQAIWTGGSFNSGGNAVFNNLSGASLDTNFDGNFNYNLGGMRPTFSNEGDFTKSGGTGTTHFQAAFDNSGTVSVASGTLRLAGGGTSSGVFVVESGGILELAGSHDFFAGSSFNGDAIVITGGTSMMNSDQYDVTNTTITNGTLELNSDGTTDEFVFNSGIRSGTGKLIVDNAFEWLGGTLSGPGMTQSNGLLNASGGTRTLTNNHVFNNAGSIQWASGNINTGNGATFCNLPNGFLEILGDVNFNYNLGGTQPTFNNKGDISKGAGTGISTFTSAFENSGLIKIDSGTLLLTQGMTQTAGQISMGGGNLNSSQAIEFNGGSLIGEGTITAPDTCFSGASIAPGDFGTTNTFGVFNFDGDLKMVNNAVFEIDINSLTGVPGTNWDFVDVDGDIQFDDPVLPNGLTIKLISKDANGNPAPLFGFNPNSQFAIPIIAADTISGFDCSQVTFDLSEFENTVTARFSLNVLSNGTDSVLEVRYGGVLRGDVNLDGIVNLLDVSPFVAAISSGQFIAEADINCDGTVDLLDIVGFVAILTS